MNNLNNIGDRLIQIMNMLATVIITISVITFMFGLLKYVISESPDKKQNARKYIVNGLIILIVMVSFWGILALFRNQFGLPNTNLSSNPTTETIDDLKRE